MQLVPMLPRIYRFVGSHGEHIHAQPLESLPDPKFSWGWCRLEELFVLIKERGFKVFSSSPIGLLEQFSLLSLEGGRRPRKRLVVAIVKEDKCLFVKVTRKSNFDPSTISAIFVPMGWAQAVMTELAGWKDSDNPHSFRRQRAEHVLVAILRP